MNSKIYQPIILRSWTGFFSNIIWASWRKNALILVRYLHIVYRWISNNFPRPFMSNIWLYIIYCRHAVCSKPRFCQETAAKMQHFDYYLMIATSYRVMLYTKIYIFQTQIQTYTAIVAAVWTHSCIKRLRGLLKEPSSNMSFGLLGIKVLSY